MRRPALLALAAGLLATLGLPPFGWWPLALGGAGLLAALVERSPARQRAVVGLAFGIGFLAPGLWWMTEFSLPGWVLAMLLESAIVTLAVLAVPPGRWHVLGLPAAFALADAVRGRWPFGGVPVATLAQTQIGGPLLQAARLGGELLVAALVGVGGVAVAALAQRHWRRARSSAVLLLVVVLAGTFASDGAHAGEIRAAAVQGGGRRGTRAIHSSASRVFQAHLDASASVPAGTRLVLWPEDVVDVDEDVLATPEGDALGSLAAAHDATVLAGVVSGADDQPFRNEVRAWGPDGLAGPAYEKHQRVPFGEYIPFRGLVEKVADVSAVPRDARVGRGPNVLVTAPGRLGVLISYEVFFARRARDALATGADVLLVPTNASSYSSTQMPALELGAARLRAIETGRAVLQAAPTGFSALIDHRGHVVRHTDLGRRAVLSVTLERRRGRTPYTRLGDGPFVLGSLAALATAWSLTRRARR